MLAVALTVAAPTLAEEVIHFTNGTSMAIRSHSVDDAGMIHADLGGDSFIAFPAYQVESIGEAGASVRLEPSKPRSAAKSTRRMVAASSRDVGRSTAAKARPAERLAAHQRTGVDVAPTVQRDKNGLAVVRPDTTSKNPHKRSIAFTGRGSIGGGGRAQRDDGGRLGSTSVGRREMIQSSSGNTPRSARPRLSGLQKQGKAGK